MACCIFALSCPDPAPSAAYIAMHGADVKFENDDLEKQLRRWYATEDANTNLHNTLDPKTTVARRRHTTAVKFLKEWKLHKWVETTNLEKALAPCSSLMCQLGGPPGIEPAAIPFVVGSTCKHKSKLQWMATTLECAAWQILCRRTAGTTRGACQGSRQRMVKKSPQGEPQKQPTSENGPKKEVHILAPFPGSQFHFLCSGVPKKRPPFQGSFCCLFSFPRRPQCGIGAIFCTTRYRTTKNRCV